MTLIRAGPVATVLAAIALSGCGGNEGTGARGGPQDVEFAVGGDVRYAGDAEPPISGAEVTITAADGEVWTAVTSSGGLWTVSGLPGGIYLEHYAAEGYEPFGATFALEAFGENDVANPFVSRPTAFLEEWRLRGEVSPFGIEVEDGSTPTDGIGGASLVYDDSSDGALSVTFDRPLTDGYLLVEDGVTGTIALANLNSAGDLTLSIDESAIDALNGGTGLSKTTNSAVFHVAYVFAESTTPIYGLAESLQVQIRFHASP